LAVLNNDFMSQEAEFMGNLPWFFWSLSRLLSKTPLLLGFLGHVLLSKWVRRFPVENGLWLFDDVFPAYYLCEVKSFFPSVPPIIIVFYIEKK